LGLALLRGLLLGLLCLLPRGLLFSFALLL
jgi:hypothetical protein